MWKQTAQAKNVFSKEFAPENTLSVATGEKCTAFVYINCWKSMMNYGLWVGVMGTGIFTQK